MDMKSICVRFGVVLATVLLITNTVMCSILLMNNASTTQDKVESLTTNQACGQCLDLAYEGVDADFSFVDCKENLKRFEITRENGETEFTYSSDIPAITRNETLESVRTYDDLDSAAFEQSYTEKWLDMKREPNYEDSAVLFVFIFSLCAFCCLGGLGAVMLSQDESESEEFWRSVWGSSSLLMMLNIFVLMTTVIATASVEVQQPQMFEETECLVIPVGYSFYHTLIVLDLVLFVNSIWMMTLSCMQHTSKTSDSGPNEVIIGCLAVSLLLFGVLWVVLTVMGLIVLDTVKFDGVYRNWLIALGLASGAVCCIVFVCIPLCVKVPHKNDKDGQTGPASPFEAVL